MRTKDTLFALENVAILFQYLFMNGDYAVTFNNGLTDLKLRMDENCSVLCLNLNFPDTPEMDFSSQMTPAYTLDVIQTLQTMPPEEYKESFTNRWDEIKTITLYNLAQNKIRQNNERMVQKERPTRSDTVI